MKIVQALKIIEEMKTLEASRLEYLEHYEVPQRDNFLLSYRDGTEADQAWLKELSNHQTIVANAKDRVDALELALFIVKGAHDSCSC